MAKKAKEMFRIIGRVIDHTTRQGLAGLRVEAWDKDLLYNDLVGSATTDAEGRFHVEFTDSYFKELFLDRQPDLFFKVFRGDGLIKSTEDSVLWNVAAGETEVVIEVDIPAAAKPETFVVRGEVRDADGSLLAGVLVKAFDKDLRRKELLGEATTNKAGEYEIRYSDQQFRRAEKGSAYLVVKAFAADGSPLAASPVLFNAPPSANVDLTVPAEALQPPTLFERIGRALAPLLEGLRVEELEEDKEHQDLSFLSGETGFEKQTLARFVLAHKLAEHSLQPEFWFVLLGGSFFQFAENQSLKEQLAAILDSLSSLDASSVRKSLTRAFNQKEIPEAFRENVAGWVEAFLKFVAVRSVSGGAKPTFVKLALEHAGIEGDEKQEKFARLFNEHRALTPELLGALEKDRSFKKEEIADLRTSFHLAELTQGDFSVVKMLKEEFGVRQPEKIRTLAKKSESEWVNLVKEKHAAGDIKLPIEMGEIAGQIKFPEAEVYGKTLARQFREAFPTTAFAGGLERALQNGDTHGLRHAEALGRFLDGHEKFELLNTPVDDFFKNNIDSDFQTLAEDDNFRLEVKAVQRVFKLAPTFEATDALLADDLHSAQKVYRMGKSEFVRRYADRPGFTDAGATLAWNRAADTYAAVLTVVADLIALDPNALPKALQKGTGGRAPLPEGAGSEALSSFPNWNNLFKTGDLCECEHCRSVLGPAAYFADLLMFLKDRKAVNPKAIIPAPSAKDILFHRRPDLGYLGLNCANALTPFPYIDTVCEVLEDVVAAGENDREVTGLTTILTTISAALALVGATQTRLKTFLLSSSGGADFSLSQVDPKDPNRWVIHGDEVAYLLKKKATPDFFAEILRNTKASAAELRAYPQYVNPKAYDKLRAAKYPLTLPFDLFAEEVRAAFQKSNLQRWDLMRTLRGVAAPNNPTDGEIAAEYFGISISAKSADPSENGLILKAAPTDAEQQTFWGESSIPGNLKNVKVFLQKTGLEYNELLALLDLKFINRAGNIAVQHPADNRDVEHPKEDPSCDTDKKVIKGLDAAKLDQIHRFLRLWRKLKGWKMWELDLVIRHPHIGKGSIDEPFLINLFYFSEVRNKLGGNTTIEQVCALFGDLNTETRFTKLHEKREDGLYQNLFLNKRLIHPLDTAFKVASVDVPGPTVEKISTPTHQPVALAALGIREADLVLLKSLTKASDGTPYITDDLTLTNLSFIWRHAWLAKLLKFKAEDWKILLKVFPQTVPVFPNLINAQDFLEKKYHIKRFSIIVRRPFPAVGLAQADVQKILLKIFHQDISDFACPKSALEFLERIDQIKAAGFTPDELNWLLAADRSAKAAVKEADAARFLAALRKELQGIQAEYDAARYQFLTVTPPTDVDGLTALLTSLLQRLSRDETATQFFIATLKDEVRQQKTVTGLPAGFVDFPAAIKTGIRISYDKAAKMLHFSGLMTAAQQTTLLSLASLTGIAAYQDAIKGFFTSPRLAVKFFEPVFTAPLTRLPAAVDFKTLPDAALAQKISYDSERRLLRFAGILGKDEQAALEALSSDVAYRNALTVIAAQPGLIVASDDRIWLTDNDLDVTQAANNTLAKRLANAAKKALNYLSATSAENAVVQESSAQLGLTEALTRRLLTQYAVLPGSKTLMTYLTGDFAAAGAVVSYDPLNVVLKTTFDGWFWANRVAAIWKKRKITLAELEKIIGLTAGAQLLDFLALPLDDAGAIASLEKFLRTSRLLKMRDTLQETEITLLEVLEKLNSDAYAAAKAQGLPIGFAFPAAITSAPNNIPIQYDEPNKLLRFAGLMSAAQREILLTHASLATVTSIATYQQAIKELSSSFATDVQRLSETWLSADVEALTASLDLAYPMDYLLAESWERLRRVFHFLDNLNASANTVKKFAAPAMTDVHAKTIKELLRSKFGTETWLTLSAEIQDTLRERKRDALVAFLLTQPPADAPSGKWENTNDLYAYYLLDVEMSCCQLTSRLVQASGSVQLFVQRCFMGLEPDVVVQADGANGDSAWRWWKWMRQYRVWEANRKVFLWPENWIEPELKKDKSPFFKDMENELLQNEMNQYTAETAFSNYLEKLDGVAQLEIAGFFQEDDGDNTIVHVFGRTAGAEPHLYYYRRYDYRQWTPWEKVELDIQGDYLIPAVVNKRLYLFWPVFTEVPDETENDKVKLPTSSNQSKGEFTPDKTKKKLRMQMAVSEYRQGKWTPKKVSKDFDESSSYYVEIGKKHYRFFAIDRSEVDGRFSIRYDGYSQTIVAADKAAAQNTLDDALAKRKEAQGALYAPQAALYAPQAALDKAQAKRNEAQAVRDFFQTNLDAAQAKRNEAQTNLDAAQAKRNEAQTKLDKALKDRDEYEIWAQNNALVLAKAALYAPQAGLAQAQATLDVTQPVLDYAETVLDKAETKRDNAQTKLDRAETKRDNAQAKLDAAQTDVNHAEDKLDSFNYPPAAFNYPPTAFELNGAFEISGCKGVPERTNLPGSFGHAIRPEQASVGDDPVFLKWMELDSRSNSSKNDFTLKPYSSYPLMPVLTETPWIFKMTPPWHLSYMDKLLLDGQMLFSQPQVTQVGSGLPFFYNDKKHTFFVLPAYQWPWTDTLVEGMGGGVRYDYPAIKKAVRQLEDSYEGELQTSLDRLDLSTKLPAERHQDEQGIYQQFPEMSPPPYTDTQFKNLWKALMMRVFHYNRVGLSPSLFPYTRLHFKNFYHPFVCDFAKLVYNPLKGIPALMSRETQLKNTGFSFEQIYQPNIGVVKPAYPSDADYYPREVVDFTPDGAYSPYNWELFFHAPLLIANSLSKNQRFEEAREWYHFIFNPIGVESTTPGGSPMRKYWITKPFFETTVPQYVQQRIDNILRMLAGDRSVTGYSAQAKKDLEDQVFDWRTNPFEPHRIANYRTVAYQKTVVMKYLDNLVAWGDNLFRQDSMESINEATQLYILAAEILGPRPKVIPPQAKPPVASFNELETEFDKFSNALVQVENLVPVLSGNQTMIANQAPLPMLYFCIPQNDKMLGYWDTVADRLYKIRHCMNIEGVVRQLALFEPPIDPAALVKAVAAGVDISAALADLNAPLPLYRFNVLLQKANEICNDVKALGSALLAALEKKDAEALGLLRQSQEIRLLEAVKTVRDKQIEEAKENLEGVKKSKVVVETRRNYYRDIERLITQEKLHLDKLSEARTLQEIAQGIKLGASIISYLPAIDLGASGFGGSPIAKFKIGGLELGQAASLASDVLSFLSQIAGNDASMASSKAGFDRRWDDWKLQERLAEKELDQLDHQIASAELRITIAENELDNHVLQIENAKATDVFMRSKYTNQELYQWQVGQISGVYFQSYKLAYDLAKRAERCFRFELGLQDSSYINFGYWDSLKKGLLSGEKLQYDLRRLETAYLEQNRREFELTKPISLALLDPLALVKLRETGRCFFHLPEEIFDLDYPGHYFRRIKSVSLTLPCVVGPYTTISCTLRLLKNSIRINTANGNGYPHNTDGRGLPADDGRFIENNIPVKATAASNAQNDSGVFELSFRDERYLPFEGAGALSEWSLELFNDNSPDFGKSLRQFDYKTISDAILHVKYTAREDAGPFKNGAVTHLRNYFEEAGKTPSLRMFNLRQEFPTQWHRFLNPTNPTNGNIFELEMSPSLFPFRDEGKTLKVNSIWLLARCTNAEDYSVILNPPLPAPSPPGSDTSDTMRLVRVNQYGGLHFSQKDVKDVSPSVAIVPTGPPVKWQLKMTHAGPGGGNLQEDLVKKVMEVEDVLLVLGYEWE